MMYGEGIFYFALGGYIYGNFVNNKAQGICILVFPNKDTILGAWHEGKLQGQSVKFFANQKYWELCEYNQGELVRKLKQGKGQPNYSISNASTH